ncbi:MAG: FAD-binding domain-containing protein, partial [Pseudomonadota bacterium]
MNELEWRPTRSEGVARLTDFAPRAGTNYAKGRNTNTGPGVREHVSALSPWISHRLVLEEEVISVALDHHRFEDAQPFLQEVCWRAYFKGWLERRPSIWARHQQRLQTDIDRLDRDAALRSRYEAAIAGATGIDGFDHWARELAETGWLHNHARMWFASIWIFTLRLPWSLGADFFYRTLIDGDPASNTLSWRWVAGLHTKGKTYLARPDNIETFSNGRFRPEGLAEEAPPVLEPPTPAPDPSPVGDRLDPGLGGLRYGLLLTEHDLHPESLPLAVNPSAILALSALHNRSPLTVGALAQDFTAGALDHTCVRIEQIFQMAVDRASNTFWRASIIDWAKHNDLKLVVVARPPVGPAADLLSAAEAELTAAGIRIIRFMRRYDEVMWRHA